MLKRLRLKFICINMAIVTVLLASILCLVFGLTRTGFERESLQMMRAMAVASPQPEEPQEAEVQPAQQLFLFCFVLEVGEDVRLVASNSGLYELSDQEFLDRVAGLALSSGGQSGILAEYSLRFCRVETQGAERIAFANISTELSAVRQLVRTCLLAGAAGFFAFLLISLFLARWAVKPVAVAWKQQRRFITDASHELKTPLTVILSNAELLQSPEYGEADRDRFSVNILCMARRMRSLVEELLELARVENGQWRPPPAPVDLSRLAEDALLPFEPVYFEKGLAMESRIDGGILVKGDAARLLQLLDILLDNAQKYASPDAAVSVSLKRQDRAHCLLAVANAGEPISREDLDNIFQRFYRTESAKSTGYSYGLGLPIARHIAMEHRGRIWAESAGGVNTFFVRLPLLRQSPAGRRHRGSHPPDAS